MANVSQLNGKEKDIVGPFPNILEDWTNEVLSTDSSIFGLASTRLSFAFFGRNEMLECCKESNLGFFCEIHGLNSEYPT